jgi:tetratricopeptide (TPR) repeat protein
MATSTAMPSQIGRYRIRRLIGEGGMGVVYEAEQDNPRRTVALKVLKAGFVSPKLLRRFDLESRALGRLQHPGIAQIHEAGTADTGIGPQPYFAMEFIEGVPVTEYAEQHGLSTRQRLEMVAKIAEAVQHAHQRGLIHCDLKPANILVDKASQPKILDFGVARTLDADAQPANRTDAGRLVGTLAYMSPEQVLADPLAVDTRSDVYSLGVLLYELLAGRLPYSFGRTLPETIHAISDEAPTRLGRINNRYSGDIETIVAKAMEKDKTRRYGSAVEFAADITRYIRDEPIVARPPTAMYRLRKFSRRHRALVAGIAAVFIVLAAGIAASTILMLRARHAETQAVSALARAQQAEVQMANERDKARSAGDEADAARSRAQRERDIALLEELRADTEAASAVALMEFVEHKILGMADPLAQGDRTPNPDITVREALDLAAAQVEKEFANRPHIESRLHEMIGGTYARLGIRDKAIEQLQLAIALQSRIQVADHRETLQTMSDLAALRSSGGSLPEAANAWRAVVNGARRSLGDADPLTRQAVRELIAVYRRQSNADSLMAAETLLAGMLREGRLKLGENHPATLESVQMLAHFYEAQRRFTDADRLLTDVLKNQRRTLGENHAAALATVNLMADLSMQQGKLAEAEALLVPLTSDAIITTILNSGRRGFEDHPTTLESVRLLADIYENTARPEKAQHLRLQAARLGEAAYGAGRTDVLKGDDVIARLVNTAKSAGGYVLAENKAAAEPLVRQAMEGYGRIVGAKDGSADLVGQALVDVARTYAGKGRVEEADAVLMQLWDIHRKFLGSEYPKTVGTLAAVGDAYRELGIYGKAEDVLSELWALQRKLLGESNPATLDTLTRLEQAYMADGRFDRAEELTAQHLRSYLAASGAEDRESYAIRKRLGIILENQGDYAKAEETFRTLRSLIVRPQDGTGSSIPMVRSIISHIGYTLFRQHKYAEAEAALNEAAGFFDRPSRSEGEIRYNWEGVLGASLVAQKKHAEAEPRLLACYKGRIEPLGPPSTEVVLFTRQDAVEWLVRLYEEWDRPDDAKKWRSKLSE